MPACVISKLAHKTKAVQSISYLLKQVSEHQGQALALVDELATSTNSTDGMAIAWAVAEKLISLEASTVFATHYVELDRLSSTHPVARTSHMACEDKVHIHNALVLFCQKG